MNGEFACPDCSHAPQHETTVNRRDFVKAVGLTAATAAFTGRAFAQNAPAGAAASAKAPAPETAVKTLYDTLTPAQKKEICFPWDYKDDRGLLRTHVSNNWDVVTPKEFAVGGKFFSADQQDLIKQIFLGLYNPEWHDRVMRQLKDDAGGYGKSQTIALFGEPGTGKFQFLMTGRHITIRCDGDSEENVAFGGPIFYGHAASGFNEKPGHPDNVYWHQAVKANSLFGMLSGKQREAALVKVAPPEAQVGFKGKAAIAGIPVADLSADQKGLAQEVLKTLLEPYRLSDRDEALKHLNSQGGLDQCRLAFFQQNAKGDSLDLGDDKIWDVWRLEGPSFVWHFRGVPHVHVWVNVASDPTRPLNARG